MKNSISRLLLVAFLLAAGIWLAAREAGPAPETTTRRTALGALAPGRPPAAETAAVPESGSADPVSVDLSAIPAGVSMANGLYAQWQRGEVDLTEEESILPAAEIAARREQSLSLPASPTLSAAPAPGTPVPGIGWPSIDFTNSGGWTPPDPQMAAGANHLIAVVNSAFAIYNKSGVLVGGPYDFATFMGRNANCRDSFAFDPNVLYDESADRYVLAIDSAGIYYCLAVSATANPLGNWNIYAFRVGNNTDFFDYPHAGVGLSHIFAGANIFDASFKEARVYAFDKSDLYAGRSVDWAAKSLPLTEDTPIPMHAHGWDQGTWPTGPDHYFITDYNYNGETYRVWRWRNPTTGGAPAAVGVVNLRSYTGVAAGYPINAPQKGSAALLQANDYRPHDFEYRNGFAWTTQTIACNPGGGTVNCVRWAKIDPATATIADAGVLATNGQHRIFPNLAVNRCDDMAIGYTKTSSALFPGVYVSGRESADPAGTLQAEVMVQDGAIAYTAFDGSPHRWGDYTGMTIDPDGQTFWYLGQYSKSTGNPSGRWGTYISALSYADCGGTEPDELTLDLSARTRGTVGGVRFQAADVVRYENGSWSMRFDASDVGITRNISTIYRQANAGGPDILYLVLAAGQSMPGVGMVTPNDILKFTPTQLGPTTAGEFSLYFDGSDVGLTTTGERIDALDMDGNRLLISTVGSGSVPRAGGKLAFADEDVIAFTPATTGPTTSGTWAAYFDGSAAVPGLSAEDVNGLWADPGSDDLYISLFDAYDLGGVAGDGNDILKLTPSGGAYAVSLVGDGGAAGFPSLLDAFNLEP